LNVRLTQLDGALPNLAIMKLASWHIDRGDSVTVTRRIERDLFEETYDRVYGSVLFDFSGDRLARFRKVWPDAIVGGTGAGEHQLGFSVELFIGGRHDYADYSGYPDFNESIGFTQRGCRLRCKFCVVPRKEGKPVAVGTVNQIWRGEQYPKKVHLLDNDFFGNPEWRDRIKEIRDGKFRVCLSQGINVRLINQEAAEALATIEYRDTKFSRKRLYTAWDNLKDEAVFFRGMDTLERAGIPGKNVMAYMLIGFDPTETWDRIWHRFNRMVERGIKPYPMVFNRARKDLCAFQRWVNLGLYRIVPWEEYTGKAA
jgi:hypothetical protein